MGIRTPDLLHAIANPLGSLACGAPTGVSGSGRHGSGRGLRRSRSATDLQDAAPRRAGLSERLQSRASGMLFRLGPWRSLPTGGVQADGQVTVR
jgi:hypothetical protein